jgi:hypothetical protein
LEGGKTSKTAGTYYLGDDMAYKATKGGVLRFTIGGEVQTEQDFDRQVKARFGDAFKPAWKEALAYVGGFDKETLLSGRRFYNEVYRPRRDELAKSWTEESQSEGQPGAVKLKSERRPTPPIAQERHARRGRRAKGSNQAVPPEELLQGA